MKSKLEERVEWILKSLGVMYEREYRFDPKRRWRFDFVLGGKTDSKYVLIPNKKGYFQQIAIECEGGVFSRGRHTRGMGFTKDTEKYNRAAILGWKVLRYTAQTLCNIERNLKELGVI